MNDREAVTATLEVPQQHLDLFRLAALHELGHSAEWVKDQQKETSGAEEPGHFAAYLVNSVGGPMSYLEASAEVVRELFAGRTKITSRVANLAHIAEAMSREVVKPRIAESLNCMPVEHEDVAEVERLSEALTWSVRTAADLNALYAEGCTASHVRGLYADDPESQSQTTAEIADVRELENSLEPDKAGVA